MNEAKVLYSAEKNFTASVKDILKKVRFLKKNFQSFNFILLIEEKR
jgi:hypothetical protein